MLACAQGKEIEERDRFVFNTAFRNRHYRIKINQVQMKETVRLFLLCCFLPPPAQARSHPRCSSITHSKKSRPPPRSRCSPTASTRWTQPSCAS